MRWGNHRAGAGNRDVAKHDPAIHVFVKSVPGKTWTAESSPAEGWSLAVAGALVLAAEHGAGGDAGFAGRNLGAVVEAHA
jgi:hypothetical protein